MALPLRERAYERLVDVLSARARRKHGADFAAVEAFLLFVGYPRRGHSIVGACLNANRDAVVSHELDASRLYPAPTGTRRRVDWPPGLLRDVERRASDFPFLNRYELEDSAPEELPTVHSAKGAT
jgi:hypothetical protein